MKLRGVIILLALFSGVFLLQGSVARAQDTLTVQWLSGGNVVINALYNTFVADTINRPPGRVYKLLRGGYYINQNTIDNTGRPLRIVGAAPTADPDSFPPLIQMYQSGGSTSRMFEVQDDLTLQGLTITGADDVGGQTSYQPIQVDGSHHKIIVDHCYFDRSNFAVIAFQNGTHNVIYYTNNHFRDLLESPSTQKYAGRGVSIWADQDTVIFENNTLFMMGFCAFQMEGGAIAYLRFNHNTLVNSGRQDFVGGAWRSSRFTNNLIINPFWHGEDHADYTAPGRDARAYNSGFWGINPLPSIYGPEQGRSNLFSNNAAYRDPLFQAGSTYYADSIRAQWFVNRVTKEDFLDRFPSNNVIQDTMWVARPGPSTNFTYPDSLIPRMWANIEDLRHGVNPATPYWFMLPTLPGDPNYCPQCVKWPIPERFDYQTPANLLTAGTDGLPLGDLNWFPTQKAQFLANYNTYIGQIEAMAPHPATFQVWSDVEAEVGTLGNGATVSTFSGFSWFEMQNLGFIRWDFTVPTAIDSNQLKLIVRTRSGSVDRGEHTYLNGTEIVNHPSQWGEYHWWCTPGWSDVPISKDSVITGRGSYFLTAGANSIRVTPSWGYQDFAGIMVVSGSDTVLRLLPPDASYQGVIAHGSGSPWIPSRFKSVAMGTNGTVTWNVTVPPDSAGNYALQLFYQNYVSAQTAQIAVDGVNVGALVPMPSNTDSTGLSVLSYPPTFALSAGAHAVRVTSSVIKLDHVAFNKVITSVGGHNGLPEGYALEQNYPNPFNPSTTIRFTVPKASDVTLTVFNILGQKVATLVNGHYVAGEHFVKFDGANFASGVYFYRFQTSGFVTVKKMMLLK